MKQAFHLDDWYVEPDRHCISRGAEVVHLQPKMLAVLQVLVEHPGQTVEKYELLDLVWPRQYVNEEVLKRVILKLRQALGDDAHQPRYIETIHRKGYRLLCTAQVTPESRDDSTQVWTGGSPFRSLGRFQVNDGPIFFGRSSAVAEASVALTEQRERKCGFLLITGASGVGKSSFARAGLLPALMKQRKLGTADILIHNPAEVAALDPHSKLGQIIARLVAQPLEQEHSSNATPVLLIDQFEEALALEDTALVMQMVHLLARSGFLDVIVTLREDFIPVLNDWPAMARLRQGSGTFTLGKPSQSELAEILQGPAKLAGFRFESSNTLGSLKSEIISSANHMRQALPLLQFLLHRMYETRDDEVLTWKSYHELGGLVGAISRHADEVMNDLKRPLRKALPDLLRYLTQFDLENYRVTRRPALDSEIRSNEHVEQLAHKLVDARLLTSGKHVTGGRYYSLVHETLLEQWGEAREWSEENLERLAAFRRTQVAYNNWRRGDKSSDLLLRSGKALADGRSVTLLADLNEDISEFIRRSQARSQRLVGIRRLAVVMLALLAIVSSYFSFVATQQREAAEHNLGLSNRVTNFVIGMFNTTSPNTNVESLTARQMLDEGVRRIPVELAEDSINRGQLLHAAGRLYLQMGEFERAEDLLTQAFSVAREGEREKYQYAWALAELRDKRNLDLADKREDELLKIAISNLIASGASNEEIANAYWRAARLVMPEWIYAPYYWEKAYDYYADSAFVNHPQSPEMLAELAFLLAYWWVKPVKLRDRPRALQLMAQSLTLYRLQGRQTDPAYFKTLEAAASLEHRVGSTTRAIELQRSAAQGSADTLGRLHIATPFRWHALGDYLLDEGKYDQASRALQQAAEMYLESYRSETPKWFETSLSLAEAWFSLGKLQEAGQLLDVLAVRQEQVWGVPNHPKTWRLWQLRGHLARSSRNLPKAAGAYTQALKLFNRIIGDSDSVEQRVALELDFLSCSKSTELSGFSTAYFHSKKGDLPAYKDGLLWNAKTTWGARHTTDFLIKLLHIDCTSTHAELGARWLQANDEFKWENETWQQYAAENNLAQCGYIELDASRLRANVEKIAKLTHPSTFMAIEATDALNQYLGAMSDAQ